ncbi:9565_t:CDS:2, partial [Ambispora leptoticha]
TIKLKLVKILKLKPANKLTYAFYLEVRQKTFQFLVDTTRTSRSNTIFIFASTKSILFDYSTGIMIKVYPIFQDSRGHTRSPDIGHAAADIREQLSTGNFCFVVLDIILDVLTNKPMSTIISVAGTDKLGTCPFPTNYLTSKTFDRLHTRIIAVIIHFGFVTHSQHMSQRFVNLCIECPNYRDMVYQLK